MSKAAVVWWLLIAGLALAAYVLYAYKKIEGGPDLSDALGVVISMIGLGGAARILYLVFWEQPDNLATDDLVCLFIGAIAVAWCSITAASKSFRA